MIFDELIIYAPFSMDKSNTRPCYFYTCDLFEKKKLFLLCLKSFIDKNCHDCQYNTNRKKNINRRETEARYYCNRSLKSIKQIIMLKQLMMSLFYFICAHKLSSLSLNATAVHVFFFILLNFFF